MKISVLILTLILVITIITGCHSTKDINEFKEEARSCVQQDESIFVELYDLCEANDNFYIYRLEGKDKPETGEICEFNNSKYNIEIYDEEIESDIDYNQIIESFDYLSNKYSITHLRYDKYRNYLESQFDENYLFVDFNIQYYPPDSEPEDAVEEYESYEFIKEGFYIYLWYPGL